MTEPRDWDVRVHELIEMGLYGGGRIESARKSWDQRGLHAEVTRTAQNDCLRGELTWRPNNQTTAMQSAYHKVGDSNIESFHRWFSPEDTAGVR